MLRAAKAMQYLTRSEALVPTYRTRLDRAPTARQPSQIAHFSDVPTAQMAEKRIREDAPLLTDVRVERGEAVAV